MIAVGHSHMVCFLNAAVEEGLSYRAILLKGVVNEGHLFGLDRADLIEDVAKPDFGPEATELLSTAQNGVYSFVGGIQHVQLGIRTLELPREPLFDFVLPEQPDLPVAENAVLLPYEAVREALVSGYGRRIKLMQRVCTLAPGPVYQFAPPPPVSDVWIERLYAPKGKKHQLPTRFVRYKLWRVAAEVFRTTTEPLGACFVDAPPASMDAEGFMLDDLVRNITHGNLEFGKLLLDHVRSLS